MHAHISIRLGVCSGCDTAANRLENQGDKVAADERDGIGARPETRETRAINDDQPREAEVDGCGEEGGTDGEAYEISIIASVMSIIILRREIDELLKGTRVMAYTRK
jgi:hypothetical protein